MAYPRRLLNTGENIELDLRPHWWYFWRHIMTGVPLFIAFVFVVGRDHGTLRTIVLWLIGVVAVAWAVWLLIEYASWSHTYFVVTNNRVIYRTGVLSRHGVEIPLE